MSAVVDEEAGRRPASTRRSKRPDPTAVPRPRLSRCPWYRRKLREQEGGRVRTSAARGAAANGAGASRWRSARHRRYIVAQMFANARTDVTTAKDAARRAERYHRTWSSGRGDRTLLGLEASAGRRSGAVSRSGLVWGFACQALVIAAPP